ncbi:Hsp70 family protein [Nocardia cyriacigeorgica]|uniref:Hsp70 family protein n=1 Tax=Nocardia cyriacigeorgica TaxID=135487 RepID=UPI00158F45A7|nr:Hsp70 family protein [Nocardia cyriacigeorgica]
MAFGLGLSIGTVNTVSAVAEEDSVKAPPGRRRRATRPPAVTHRTTLTFDSTGMARLGTIPRHGRVVTEFADLTERGASAARVGNRALAPADLVAVVADCLIAEARDELRSTGDDTGITLTHPVGYSDDQVGALRTALDAAGLERVVLVAEPVAAAAWLEAEHGPLMPGLALVYDLGGASLDVTLVRVGAGCPDNPVMGTLRSRDFGGRAFGALVTTQAVHGQSSEVDPDVPAGAPARDRAGELRSEHVRGSLELVYRCLRQADVTMADVDRVLVVGGAARPAEVVRVLGAELARPVVTAPDPERTIAAGAAIMARRMVAASVDPGRKRGSGPRAWEFSRRKLRRNARAAVAAGVSAVAVALTLTVPGDAVLTALSQLGAG